MKPIYLLSEHFDYSLQICTGDAGPGYAASFGLESITWKKYLEKEIFQDAIVDTRLQEAELVGVEEMIASRPERQFLMAVTDPYTEFQYGTPYMNFLFRLSHYPNVSILSKYQPEELTKELLIIYGSNRFLVLNYVYESENELALDDIRKRKNKVILTGSVNPSIYPERFSFKRISSRFPFRLFIDVLPHPGYPDTGQILKHTVIHEAYLSELSKYRFMFVSPSRCGLEFLKYKEAAYACVLPVGMPPKTFSEEMTEPMIQIDLNNPFLSLTRALLMSHSEYSQRVLRYRAAFRKNRSREKQLGILNNFIEKRATSLYGSN